MASNEESWASSSLEELLSMRRACRSVATRKINATDLSSVESLEKGIYILKSKLERLEMLDDIISRQLPPDSLEDDMDQASEVNATISSNLSLFNRTLSSLSCNSGLNISTSSQSSHSASRRFKLPKLTLESFNGDLTSWNSFWDSFCTSVHENDDLAGVEKFQYLRSKLLGPAKDAIAGLSLTGANYSKAIDILHRRFGRTQAIISAHMSALMKLPSVGMSNNLSSIRSFYDKLNSNVSALDSIGVSPSQYGAFLLPIILDKLPADICLQVNRLISDDNFNFDEVSLCLLKEIEARERFMSNKVSSHPSSSRSNPSQPTASALVASNSHVFSDQTSRVRNKVVACTYCKNSHSASRCNVISSIAARFQFVKQNKLCFNCLSSDHAISNCPSSSNCAICRKRHHTSICRRSNSAQGRSFNQPQANASTSNICLQSASGSSSATQRQASSVSPVEVVVPTSPATHSPPVQMGVANSIIPTVRKFPEKSECVLLQTSLSNVSSYPRAIESVRARILFDKGAQRSFITTKLRKQLGLKSLRQEEIEVGTFGNNGSIKRLCDVVEVFVKPLFEGGEEICLQVFTVDTICSPLQINGQISLSTYDHLCDLTLADPDILHCGNYSVDILLGCDQYWNVVTGDIIRGSTGPVAMESKLGYLLSGNVSSVGGSSSSVLSINVSLIKSATVLSSEDRVSAFLDSDSIGVKREDDECSLLMNCKSTLDCCPTKAQSPYSACLPWKPFVQSIIGEIYTLTPPSVWEHCPGTCNPANLPSRGTLGNGLISSMFWWEGPAWLKQESSTLPRTDPSGYTSEDHALEVRKVCMICRRLDDALTPPKLPPLLEFRVQKSHPFDYVGIVFAGPLFVNSPREGNGGASSCKVYVCLFTCAVTRCLHLEFVNDLTSESFLRCFRRFCSRRAVPSIVISDNGKTFVKAAKDLAKIFQAVGSKEVRDHATDHNVKWMFNVERGAWWGGFWERLVQSVKRCLKKVCGNARLTYDELFTVLCEVEAVLNSRPLTYVSSDVEPSGPLFPSLFLTGDRLTALPSIPARQQVASNTSVPQSTVANLVKRLKYQEALRNHFWSRWQKEYLTSLREFQHVSSSSKQSVISEDQIVLVQEAKVPRLLWKLARVVRLLPGRDGHVRSAELRIVSGSNKKVILIRRPIQLLYPLEMSK